MTTQTRTQNSHIKDTELSAAFNAVSLFSAATEAQRVIMTTWAAHTYVYREFAASGRLDFCADEPQSGKTVGMDVTVALSANPLVLGYNSQASIYDWLDEHPDTTFGLDEIDKAFGSTGRKTSRPILAAVVNDGYTQTGKIMVDRGGHAVLMPVFCPIAMAGLGKLPYDTATRSFMMHMHKAMPDEVYLPELHNGGLGFIGSQIKEWITTKSAHDYLVAQPRMAEHVDGDPRFKLITAPLAAIASYAGYGDQLCAAVREIQTGLVERPPTELHVLLLNDLRASWPANGPALATGEQVIDWLRSHDAGRWAKLDSGRVGQVALAGLLRQSGITSTTSNGVRGYRHDAVMGGAQS